MSGWLVYQHTDTPHDGIARLPAPPSWRAFGARPDVAPDARGLDGWTEIDLRRAMSYRPRPEILKPVNAALYLRRPLLVTGKPGVGKSTLAYAVAYQLGLGPVLRWPITSRSTLAEGLYDYDAIGRLQDVDLSGGLRPAPAATAGQRRRKAHRPRDLGIGRYLRLGPLGTALLPRDTPRVLLVDEIDKADVDLPNDLLAVFEEGRFEIPELARICDLEREVSVTTADRGGSEPIDSGLVQCRQFPFVVITSNGEREFPPAFLRRCLRVDLDAPSLQELEAIVAAHLSPDAARSGRTVIEYFHTRAARGDLATDQLLNAVHLTCQQAVDDASREELLDLLLHYLNSDL